MSGKAEIHRYILQVVIPIWKTTLEPHVGDTLPTSEWEYGEE